MADTRSGVATVVDDPVVLGYWRDWLIVRDSAVTTGWSFAAYVAARVAREEPRIYTSGGTWPPPGESA